MIIIIIIVIMITRSHVSCRTVVRIVIIIITARRRSRRLYCATGRERSLSLPLFAPRYTVSAVAVGRRENDIVLIAAALETYFFVRCRSSVLIIIIS